jgi:superfamily I DNA/RNA helicase
MVSPRVNGLSAEQEAVRTAVMANDRDVLVIAGPGSGKTHTLVESISSLVAAKTVPGDKIVAVTFTRNAAAEMRVRLVKRDTAVPGLAGVYASTFHSWVGRLADAIVAPRPHPPIMLDTAGLAVALHLFNPNPEQPFDNAEVGAADRHLEGCETFREMKKRGFKLVSERPKNRERFSNLIVATRKLRRVMRENHVMTHGTLMRSGIALASQLAPSSIAWLCLDEVQDINRTQLRLVQEVQKQTGCRILAIGDDDQGIYKFRGASSELIDWISSKEDAIKLQLRTNYRSTQNIVSFCEAWIASSRNSTAGKSATSSRTANRGLPIVLLTSPDSIKRSEHARAILQPSQTEPLVEKLGEVGVFKFSLRRQNYDLGNLEYRVADKRQLEPTFVSACAEKLETASTSDWFSETWSHILDATRDAPPTAPTGTFRQIGAPGLGAFLAALQAMRKLRPGLAPQEASQCLRKALLQTGIQFEGKRMAPEYDNAEANVLTLHGSKGLEFRGVWLPDPGYDWSEKDWETEQGMPGLAQPPELASESLEQRKNKALLAERRRLLYVGFSRPADLLIISAPRYEPSSEKWQLEANAFADALEESLARCCNACEVKRLSKDDDVAAFLQDYLCDNPPAQFKHPTWKAPKRHRVESFTSLQRKKGGGLEYDPETSLLIPEGCECPRPQSPGARVGEELHRLMHLLFLQPKLADERLKGSLTTDKLLERILTPNHDLNTHQLQSLVEHVDSYFSDTTNKPWKWLQNARSEVPFSVLIDDPHFETEKPNDGWDDPSEEEPERILLEGFIDLVQYEHGKPVRIVDYKTGEVPDADSGELARYREQLQKYTHALTVEFPEHEVQSTLFFPKHKLVL